MTGVTSRLDAMRSSVCPGLRPRLPSISHVATRSVKHSGSHREMLLAVRGEPCFEECEIKNCSGKLLGRRAADWYSQGLPNVNCDCEFYAENPDDPACSTGSDRFTSHSLLRRFTAVRETLCETLSGGSLGDTHRHNPHHRPIPASNHDSSIRRAQSELRSPCRRQP